MPCPLDAQYLGPRTRKATPRRGRVAVLSIATSETWKDGQGQRQEASQSHRVVCYVDPLVSLLEAHCRKGSRLYVEDRLETRKYDDQGTERFITEVVMRPYRSAVILLDGPSQFGRSPVFADSP